MALAVACAAVVLLAPGPAQAGPVWASLPGVDLGLRGAREPATVMHRGKIYAAMAVGRTIVVRTYDPELDAWLPVGGPLARTLNATATRPVIVSNDGVLQLAYTELDRHDQPFVIVARLVETEHHASWRIVADPLPGHAPSLVTVHSRLWVVWHARDGRIHLAQLLEAAGTWRISHTALTADSLRRPQAVEYRGAIYIVYLAGQVWRPSVGGRPIGRPRTLLSALVQRVDVTADPDAPSQLIATLGTANADVTAARIATGEAGPPVLLWRAPAQRRQPGMLHVEGLSLTGDRVRPLVWLQEHAATAERIFLAASAEQIVIGAVGEELDHDLPPRLMVTRIRRADPLRPAEDLPDVRLDGWRPVSVLVLPGGDVLTIRPSGGRLLAFSYSG